MPEDGDEVVNAAIEGLRTPPDVSLPALINATMRLRAGRGACRSALGQRDASVITPLACPQRGAYLE